MVVDLLLELHGFEVEHLKHLPRNRLVLHLLRLRVVGGLGDDGYGVGVETSVEPALDDLAVFQRVFLEDLVDILLGGLDSQVLQVAGRVFLLQDLEEGRVLDVQFLSSRKGT